ncbi:MAG: DUF4167 domain-containing protein [Maritimibacter sp.]|nr:DUF4167 domain-containing protein [Maritimibacter sp.]
MRSSKSRSRGKNRGANRSPANNINRVFDSSGPEGKVRGTPQQIIDKYTQLARDAFLAGDRVAGENFQQHAEHYTRLLSEAQRDAEEKRQQNDQQNRDRQQNQQNNDRQQNKQRDRDDQRGNGRDGNGGQPDTAAQGGPQGPNSSADVVDLGDSDTDSDSGLVETPEEQPKKKPARARKPRAKKAEAPGAGAETAPDAGNTDAGSTDQQPDAPEAAAS